jgi:hypothetical protein
MWVAVAFPADERTHRQPDDSAGRGPARSGEVRLRGSGQDEPSWAGIVIDRPFDGAENVGDQLPLVDQDRLVKIAERGIRVGPDDGGLGRDVQAQSRTAQAASRGRLAAGPGPTTRTAAWAARTSRNSRSRRRGT